jgi:C1A family cysteine protease
MNLDRIVGFPSDLAAKLRAHAVESAEQFLSLTTFADTRDAICSEFGVSAARLKEFENIVRASLPADRVAIALAPAQTLALGLAWEDGRPVVAGELVAGAAAGGSTSFGVPESFSLIDKLTAVRDQGGRGTCVSFAFTAAVEYELQARRSFLNIVGADNTDRYKSPQFLYCSCKQRDGYPGPGTYMSTAVECLRDLGVCDEEVWKYNPQQDQKNEGQTPPPADAVVAAKKCLLESGTSVTTSTIAALKTMLSKGTNGRPKVIPFAVPVFSSWMNVESRRTGRIPMPFRGERSIGGHALCLVGYEDDANAPQGGWFIFRNSWGTSWAEDSPCAAGYGMLPYAYMQQYGRDAYALEMAESAATRTMANVGRVAAVAASAIIFLTGALLSLGACGAKEPQRALVVQSPDRSGVEHPVPAIPVVHFQLPPGGPASSDSAPLSAQGASASTSVRAESEGAPSQEPVEQPSEDDGKDYVGMTLATLDRVGRITSGRPVGQGVE